MEFKIGDMVEVIEDDYESDNSFLGLQGKVVHIDVSGIIGIDFGVEYGADTWRLADSILSENTGRYYEKKCLGLVEETYEVELI